MGTPNGSNAATAPGKITEFQLGPLDGPINLSPNQGEAIFAPSNLNAMRDLNARSTLIQPSEVRAAVNSVDARLPLLSYDAFNKSFPHGEDYKKGNEFVAKRDAQIKQLMLDAGRGDHDSQLYLMDVLTTTGGKMEGKSITVGNSDYKHWYSYERGQEGVYPSSGFGHALKAAETFSEGAQNPSLNQAARWELARIIPQAMQVQGIPPEQRSALLPGLKALASPGADGITLLSPQKEADILISSIQADLRNKPVNDEFQRLAMKRLLEIQPPEMKGQIEKCYQEVQEQSQPLGRKAAAENLLALRGLTVTAGDALANLRPPARLEISGFTLTPGDGTVKPGDNAGPPGFSPEPPDPHPPKTGQPTEVAPPTTPGERFEPLTEKENEEKKRERSLPDNVSTDDLGRIKEIRYPDKSVCTIGRDEKGDVNSITLKETQPAAEHKFIKQGDKWYSAGQKHELPGAMEVRENGELAGPVGDGRMSLVLRPDGSQYTEHKLATGALLIGDSKAGLQGVSRNDGSSVQDISEPNTRAFLETNGDEETRWTLKRGTPGQGDDVWVSDGEPAAERRNMKLESNGNLTFTGAQGERHIIRSNGAELVEGKGQAKFDFDDEGRISSVAYPDRRNVFNFDYEAGSEKIAAVRTFDKATGKEKLEKPDSQWGEPMLSADGVYSQMSYQVLGGQVFKGLQTFDPNGEFTYSTLLVDGRVKVTDAYGKIVHAVRQAIASDFVQAAASDNNDTAALQQARDQRVRRQQEDRANAANAAAGAALQKQIEDYKAQQRLQPPPPQYAADGQAVQYARTQCGQQPSNNPYENSGCGTGSCGGSCGGGCGSCGGSTYGGGFGRRPRLLKGVARVLTGN
jgi:hypothetical protein